MSLFRRIMAAGCFIVIIFGTACTAMHDNGMVEQSGTYTVGLDNYYNHELHGMTGQPYHYIWSDTTMSGYSQLGVLFNQHGADTVTVAAAPDKEQLDHLSVYIIVDPDTPRETRSPNYITEPAISEIAGWVQKGGVLVLLANNAGQSEFTHLNELAGKFGIRFNEDSINESTPATMERSTFDTFPGHRLFMGVNRLFIKEISTLTLTAPAEPVFIKNGAVIMAHSSYGRGMVFALGDPWLYNEYIDIPGWDNQRGAENLVTWLLETATPVQ